MKAPNHDGQSGPPRGRPSRGGASEIPDRIQISLISIMLDSNCGQHMLIFFGQGCNTKKIIMNASEYLLDQTNAALKERGLGEVRLPIIMVAERLDRSPEVLEVIRLIIGDETLNLVPREKHFSAIARILGHAENQLAMDLQ